MSENGCSRFPLMGLICDLCFEIELFTRALCSAHLTSWVMAVAHSMWEVGGWSLSSPIQGRSPTPSVQVLGVLSHRSSRDLSSKIKEL